MCLTPQSSFSLFKAPLTQQALVTYWDPQFSLSEVLTHQFYVSCYTGTFLAFSWTLCRWCLPRIIQWLWFFLLNSKTNSVIIRKPLGKNQLMLLLSFTRVPAAQYSRTVVFNQNWAKLLFFLICSQELAGKKSDFSVKVFRLDGTWTAKYWTNCFVPSPFRWGW